MTPERKKTETQFPIEPSHLRHLLDTEQKYEKTLAALRDTRDALQQARILLDGVGHRDEQQARLAEKIDKVLRQAAARADELLKERV